MKVEAYVSGSLKPLKIKRFTYARDDGLFRIDRVIVYIDPESVREPRGAEVNNGNNSDPNRNPSGRGVEVNDQSRNESAIESAIESAMGTSPIAQALNAIILEAWEQARKAGLPVKHGVVGDWSADRTSVSAESKEGGVLTAEPDAAVTRISLRDSARARKSPPLPFVQIVNKHMNDLVMNQTHIDRHDFVAKVTRMLCRMYARSHVESEVWTMMQITELTGMTLDEWWGQYESRKPVEETAKTGVEVMHEQDAIQVSIRRAFERIDALPLDEELTYERYENRILQHLVIAENWGGSFSTAEWQGRILAVTGNSLRSHYDNWCGRK